MGRKKRKSLSKEEYLSDREYHKNKKKREVQDLDDSLKMGAQFENIKEHSSNDKNLFITDSRKDKVKLDSSKQEINKQFTLKERMIIDKDTNSILIPLTRNEEICVTGKAKMRLLYGRVLVMGFEVSNNEEIYDIFSPNCHSYLTVQEHLNENCKDISEIMSKCQHRIKNKAIIDKFRFVLENGKVSSVIQLTKLESTMLNFVTSFNPFQQLFGSSKSGYENSNTIEDIGVDVIVDRNVNKFSVTEDFFHVKEKILKQMDKDNNKVVVAQCGGKNVGKSTLGRFLINTLLNRSSEVAFLECDIGQTEFTPSGCVSLSILKKPIFGPPFTHIRQPEVCCFLGVLTPSGNPEEYLRCIHYICQQYKTNHSNIPLVINTMGWNKGIGISLLIDTLRITQPDFVIQLDSHVQSRNLPAMKPVVFGGREAPEWLPFLSETKWDPNYELVIIQAVYTSQQQIQEKFKAPDHRTLSLLSYFGKLSIPNNMITSVKPYEVPWNNIALYVPDVTRNQVMYVLNCSIVALCIVNDLQIEKSKDGMPIFLKHVPMSGCLGYGLIRSIDPVKKTYYVVTPTSFHTLQKINAFVHGTLDVPQQILLKQKSKAVAEIPYIGYSKDTIGATSIKPRRHMGRHYKQLNHD